ncbi:MAG: cytochrome c oxidase subunit II [Planctomycetota bacterium]|nr:cytochrome c oxidase subunit II [Planctomycetota bacterium]
MSKFWPIFFMFWAVVAVVLCLVAPSMNWWFPGNNAEAASTLGTRIDDLFYLILVIVTVTFVGTQIALGYVLWKGADNRDEKAHFTHGSHSLEVIWTIVPSGILLFIALYQMDVWAEYRVISKFPADAVAQPVADVTARQFEWRIRYPAPGRKFKSQADIRKWLRVPEAGDLHYPNELCVPTTRNVLFYLRSGDVQHAFFSPELRVKQDAVPGKVIPVWFNATKRGEYTLLCAELCGWGHYKMKARILAVPENEYRQYLLNLQKELADDGFDEDAPESDE